MLLENPRGTIAVRVFFIANTPSDSLQKKFYSRAPGCIVGNPELIPNYPPETHLSSGNPLTVGYSET